MATEAPAEKVSPSAAPTAVSYKDASQPISVRVEHLLSEMNLEEKAGLLFQHMIAPGPSDTFSQPNPLVSIPSVHEYIYNRKMNHFNVIGPIESPRDIANWHNELQQLVLDNTRLGIPLTLSTDPRNHFSENVGTSFNAARFSQWPEPFGLAALRDANAVQEFADTARQEYIATGLRVALHPQADLTTEYRWSRGGATFGEDADLAGELAAAYIKGFQGSQLKDGVSCMVKHFPGGGPQKDGEDPHFVYGKEQVYPGKQMEYHLKPFQSAIDAGVRQMMPYYGMPVGVEGWEEVGFSFNRPVIQQLLREKMGYEGIVCTDWGLVTDAIIMGQDMPARAWGVENLTELERCQRILEAGCDQFGGEARPELVVKLVQDGLVSMERVDKSVRRLLKEKFELGLFDDRRFVDPDTADAIVGKDEFRQKGKVLQRRSYTLLLNKDRFLPLKENSTKVYTEGFDSALISARGLQVVKSPEKADVAIIRLRCPHEPRTGGFEALFNAGSLEFSAEEKARQAALYHAVPTIVDLYLDRPAAIPEVAEAAKALLVNYGSSSEAMLDIIFGAAQPEGRLPFDMPRSMEAVCASRSDVAFDTKDPLFKFGHGLRYD